MKRGMCLRGVVLLALLAAPAVADAKKSVKKPDLKVVKVAVNQSGGEAVVAKVDVSNVGKRESGRSPVTLLLSTDRKKSRADTKLKGSKTLPAIKPRKKKSVTIKTSLPAVAAGDWFIVACAAKAKGEGKTGNNCRSSGKLTVGGDYNRRYPERFVGTAEVTTAFDFANQRPPTGASSSRQFDGTMTADVTLTRVPGPGGNFPYRYASSGELSWQGTATSSYSGSEYTENCSLSGSGTEPIVASTGTNFDDTYGFANWTLNGTMDLAPGSTYLLHGSDSSSFRLDGTCDNSENGTVPEFNHPVFPAFFPTDLGECREKAIYYTVRPDGSLKGSDSCSSHVEWTVGENENEETGSIQWTWDLKPRGPAE